MTQGSVMRSVSASTVRVDAWSAPTSAVTVISRRSGSRSSSGPAQGLNSRYGRACTLIVAPSAKPLPVTSSTSNASATACENVPMFESACPPR